MIMKKTILLLITLLTIMSFANSQNIGEYIDARDSIGSITTPTTPITSPLLIRHDGVGTNTTRKISIWRLQQLIGGSVLTFGSANRIPYMNVGGTDFNYLAGFEFDGSIFSTPQIESPLWSSSVALTGTFGQSVALTSQTGFSISNASSGNLALLNSGAGSLTFNGISWPTSDGSNGHVLTTNGSGSATFQALPVFALTNGEGTTANGTAADLGGSWSSPISIDNTANNNDAFSITSTNVSNTVSEFRLSGNDVTLNSEDTGTGALSQIFMNTSGVDLFYGDGTSEHMIQMTTTNATIASDDPSFQGFVYDDDYSANYTNRSLVDKEYVDGVVGGGGVSFGTDGQIPIMNAGGTDFIYTNDLSRDAQDILVVTNSSNEQVRGAFDGNNYAEFDASNGVVSITARASTMFSNLTQTTTSAGLDVDISGASGVARFNVAGNNDTGTTPVYQFAAANGAAAYATRPLFNLDNFGTTTFEIAANGEFTSGNFEFDGDQTVGAGQDNFVLTYDNADGQISLEAADAGITITSGTWTPTTTNDLINVDAVSGLTSRYHRIGDEVFVSGKFTLDPTAVGVCEFNMSLPISSNFNNLDDVAGVVSKGETSASNGHLETDQTDDEIKVNIFANFTSSFVVWFQGSYTIK